MRAGAWSRAKEAVACPWQLSMQRSSRHRRAYGRGPHPRTCQATLSQVKPSCPPHTPACLAATQAGQLGELRQLQALHVRGHRELLSDAGVAAMVRPMARLAQLSVCPVGTSVTGEGLELLCGAPGLRELRLGLADSRQVSEWGLTGERVGRHW